MRVSAGITHRSGMIVADREIRSLGQRLGDDPRCTCVSEREYGPSGQSEWLDRIMQRGGEGLIVRHPDRPWTGVRSKYVRKIKPTTLGEAVVLGWTMGTGRLMGMIGALVCTDNGVRFELSGMTDRERVLIGGVSPVFRVGDRVGYEYRGLTDAGLPVEGRYKGLIEEPEPGEG